MGAEDNKQPELINLQRYSLQKAYVEAAHKSASLASRNPSINPAGGQAIKLFWEVASSMEWSHSGYNFGYSETNTGLLKAIESEVDKIGDYDPRVLLEWETFNSIFPRVLYGQLYPIELDAIVSEVVTNHSKLFRFYQSSGDDLLDDVLYTAPSGEFVDPDAEYDPRYIYSKFITPDKSLVDVFDFASFELVTDVMGALSSQDWGKNQTDINIFLLDKIAERMKAVTDFAEANGQKTIAMEKFAEKAEEILMGLLASEGDERLNRSEVLVRIVEASRAFSPETRKQILERMSYSSFDMGDNKPLVIRSILLSIGRRDKFHTHDDQIKQDVLQNVNTVMQITNTFFDKGDTQSQDYLDLAQSIMHAALTISHHQPYTALAILDRVLTMEGIDDKVKEWNAEFRRLISGKINSTTSAFEVPNLKPRNGERIKRGLFAIVGVLAKTLSGLRK